MIKGANFGKPVTVRALSPFLIVDRRAPLLLWLWRLLLLWERRLLLLLRSLHGAGVKLGCLSNWRRLWRNLRALLLLLLLLDLTTKRPRLRGGRLPTKRPRLRGGRLPKIRSLWRDLAALVPRPTEIAALGLPALPALRRLEMLVLLGRRRPALICTRRDLPWHRLPPRSIGAAKIAGAAASAAIFNRGVVIVVYPVVAEIIDGLVVVEAIPLPPSAAIAAAIVAMAVVDPAIIADRRPPIRRVPTIIAAVERPISRGP